MLLRSRKKKELGIGSNFPLLLGIEIPNNDDRACHSYSDEVCFYKVDFVNGLRFPIHSFIKELFFCLQLAPTQLVLNL